MIEKIFSLTKKKNYLKVYDGFVSLFEKRIGVTVSGSLYNFFLGYKLESLILAQNERWRRA